MTPLSSEKPSFNRPPKPCHNCRRRRLRCDRSLPSCHKCSSKNEACLGYGSLLRWANAVAIRGKPQGQILCQKPDRQCNETQHGHFRTRDSYLGTTNMIENWSVKFSLVDPLLQDLGHRHRLYINHCES